MPTPRFLADENIEPAIVSATRRLDPAIEFQTLDEANLFGATDLAVLEYAWRASLIVVTHDANTLIADAKSRIARGDGIAGVLVAPVWTPPRQIADSLLLIWTASSADEWTDFIGCLPI